MSEKKPYQLATFTNEDRPIVGNDGEFPSDQNEIERLAQCLLKIDWVQEENWHQNKSLRALLYGISVYSEEKGKIINRDRLLSTVFGSLVGGAIYLIVMLADLGREFSSDQAFFLIAVLFLDIIAIGTYALKYTKFETAYPNVSPLQNSEQSYTEIIAAARNLGYNLSSDTDIAPLIKKVRRKTAGARKSVSQARKKSLEHKARHDQIARSEQKIRDAQLRLQDDNDPRVQEQDVERTIEDILDSQQDRNSPHWLRQ